MSPRLLAAFVLPLVVCVLQWTFWDQVRPYAWFMFFPAVFLASWLGGLAAGLLATGTSVALVWFVFLAPEAASGPRTLAPYYAAVVFAGMGCAFAFFFERLRRMQSRASGRFEAAFEQAAVGVALVGADGRWLRANRRLCEIVGVEPAALAEHPEADLTHPDDRAAERGLVADLLAGRRTSYALEKRYSRRDGTTVWVNLSVSRVHDGDRESGDRLLIVEDIDARKLAERSLARSEARFRELVQNANSAIVQWNTDGTITFFNDFAQRLFGWHADEAIGRPVGILVPERSSEGADLSRLVEDIASRPERYRNFVNENVCRDGRRVVMSWTNRALRDDGGRVTSILAVGNDVDDRARDEAELRRRNEELERFNAASVGRELQMIALKQRVNALCAELGRPPAYDLGFAHEERSLPREDPR